jgi:peptide/nickel transport system substrate-binding protein
VSENFDAKGLKRRDLLRAGAVVAGATAALPLLAACTSPTPAPAPTKPAAAGAPAATAPAGAPAAAGGPPKVVPRNRTLTLNWYTGAREGKWFDHELWNPYSIGANHQNGCGQFYEPLAFYSAFADKEYMWLAESYKYSADYKELTIKTRTGIKWSDGVDFSADDVAYTLSSLKTLGPKVRWGVDVAQYVDSVQATDKTTVVVKFKVPASRFFWFMTYKYDIGVYIVPKHIFEKEDWTSFKHLDIAKDLPVTTSPWKVVFVSPEQKVIDRRDPGTWWAEKAGLAKMPRIERQIWLPHAGEQQTAQAAINNQLDYATSLTPATILTLFKQNDKITTHSGTKPPYGYMDWWPHSLYVNTSKKPFDNKDVRWALSYYIDRKQIVDVSWLGAAEISPLPMPYYPPLRPYIDGVKDMLAKYDTNEFNSKKGDDLLTKAGFKKDSGGFWVDGQNNRLKIEVIGTGATGNQVCPVVTELLKRQGIDASFAIPPDFDDRFQKGDFTGAVYGHGGGVRDPYDTLRLYQSATVAVPGAHLANFTKWVNPEYDKLVDQMWVTSMDDKPKLLEIFRKAMEIWLPELPDIPLTYSYHRICMNTTYWKNWPSDQNNYINEAFWHLTYPIVTWNLEPAQ